MILTPEDRAKLLKALETAPDDVLLHAVSSVKHQRIEEQQLWESVRGYVGAKAAAPVIPDAPKPKLDFEEPENEDPGGTACTRIGAKNRDAILSFCTKPRTIDEIAGFIHKRDPSDLLQLLWERGELTYSGECFRVAS